MNLEELKDAITKLDQEELNKLMMEVLPEVLPRIFADAACLELVSKLVSEESSRSYREQHMGGV